MPTERQEVTKAKQRAKRAEQIKDAADKALLRELKSSDAAAVRAALKIWNDRAFEKIEALQAEIDGKRPSNAPVGGVESVLKWMDERRTAGSGTETTDTS